MKLPRLIAGLLLVFTYTTSLFSQTTINAGLDTTICLGGTASLRSTLTGGGYGTDSYTFETFPYSPELYTGGTGIAFGDPSQPGNSQDDKVAGPFDIGFSFCFFNQTYTQFYVGSNGWVGFSNGGWTTFTSAPIPNSSPGVPKNCIMAPWEDWWPAYPSASEPGVFYYVTGTAPNRKLVVYWLNCTQYGCRTNPEAPKGSFQIVLNEQSSIVENHITFKPQCSNQTATQGVHNIDGTIAFTATNRNSTLWTTSSESTRFVPSGIKWYVGGYPGGTIVGYGPTLNASPTVTTVYTVVVQTCGGGTATDNVTVTVKNPDFSYPSYSVCMGSPNQTPTPLEPGGTFSVSPAGLTVSPTTGTINMSTADPGSYNITYTLTTPCLASKTKTMTIQPYANPVIGGSTEVCQGATGVLYTTDPWMTNYQWVVSSGGTVTAGGTPSSNSVTVTWNTPGSQTVSVNYTNNKGCSAASPTVYNVNVHSPGVPTISGPPETCKNQPGTYSTQTGMTGYTWTVTGGTITSGSGTSTININWTATGTQTISVIYTDPIACTPSTPSNISVLVKDIPLPVITGVSQICAGIPTTFTTESGKSGYSWIVTPDGTITAGGTSSDSSITVVWNTAGSKSVKVNYFLANGCQATIPTSHAVTVNALPVLSLSGPAAVCKDASGVFTAPAGFNNYVWNVSTGGTITAGGTSSSNTATIQWNNPGNQTVSINYSTASGCTAVSAFSLPVTVHSLPDPLISGPAQACINSTQTYSTESGKTNYIWSVPTGGTITSGTGTNSINVTWNTTGNQTVQVNYSDINLCTAPAPKIYNVTVNPLPVITITGSTNICQGTTVTYHTQPGMTGYLWNIPAGGTVTGGGTSADSTVSVLWTTSGNKILTVNYTNSNSCTLPAPFSYNITVNPLPAPSVTGNQNVCFNSSQTYTAAAGFSNYVWTVPAGGTITAGGTSADNTVTINWTNTGNYTVNLNYSNSFGCTAPAAFSLPVTVNALPDPSITGPAQACLNSNQVYTTETGKTGYIWSVPTGGTITSGSGTNSITVNWSTAGSQKVLVNYTDNNLCTAATPKTFNVVVHSLPVVTITGNNNVCPGIPEIYRTAAGMTGYVWSVPTGGTITAGGTASDSTITITWNTPGNHSVKVNYTDGNSCTAATQFTYNVTVKPNPVVVQANQSICSQTASSLTLQSSLPGSSYAWTCTATPSVTGYSDGTGGSIAQTLTNSSSVTGYVVYHIAATAAGCTGAVYTDTVFVKPLPDVLFNPAAPSICGGQTTNILLSSSVVNPSFTWTAAGGSPNIWGFSAGSGNNIVQTLTSTGVSLETVTYTVTPVAAACTGPIFSVTVQINPKPHMITSPVSQTICSESSTNINLLSSCPGTVFTWTPSVETGNATGMTSGTGPFIIQNITNLLPTQSVVKYTISFNSGSCIGNDTTFRVFVNPKPHVLTQNPDTAICQATSTAIHLTSDVANTTFTWTASGGSANVTGYSDGAGNLISQNLVNSGYTDETVTYTITGRANNCDGFVKTYVVTVHPKADVYFSPATQAICSGTITGISNLSHVAGTTFSWTASTAAPGITGFSAGTGNSIAQTISNSSTTPGMVTYTVTPLANACTGDPQQVNITVNPVAHVTTTPNAITHCSGTPFDFTFFSDVAGTSYTWTAASTTPLITGFSDGSGSSLSHTLINTGFDIDSVIYTVTPTANSCTGVANNYYAIVNPIPDVTNSPLSGQICSGNNTNIALTSHVAGTNYSWTCTPSSGNITGYNAGTGTTISNVLVNTGLNPEFVQYHITPSANTCTGNVVTYTMNISEVPDVYFSPAAQTVCSAQQTSISILSHVTGSTFTWTATGSTANVSGFSGGNGNSINQTLTNSGNNFETVTYNVTPEAFGCPPGIPQQVQVTVNPKPAVTNTQTAYSICSKATTNIPLQSTQLGSTYSWAASGSSPAVTGFSNSSGPVIAQTLANSSFVNQIVNYSVVPRANNCNGDSIHFFVTVFPVADVLFTPSAQSFCTGGTTGISINSDVAGASYSWTAAGSSANVTGFSPGTGNLIQQTLTNSGVAIEKVRYLVTPAANGCTGDTSSALVSVNPNPVIALTICYDPVVTTDSKPLTLSGASPSGGIWSGPGVTGNTFTPSVAGAGTHVLTYSYTNTWTCNSASNQTITVADPLAFSCGGLLTDIRDNKTYPTVMIGTQCWMAANLNYGTSIPTASTQRNNCTPEKFCHGNNPTGCDTKGGLYQWDEMMAYSTAQESQGICPPAWHVPSENDWNILFSTYVDKGFAGSPLKSTGFSGFNAQLWGNWFDNVTFHFPTWSTILWSSNSHGTYKAWAHGLNDASPSVATYPGNRSNAFSVRCVKD